jgi:hypothetical protein
MAPENDTLNNQGGLRLRIAGWHSVITQTAGESARVGMY